RRNSRSAASIERSPPLSVGYSKMMAIRTGAPVAFDQSDRRRQRPSIAGEIPLGSLELQSGHQSLGLGHHHLQFAANRDELPAFLDALLNGFDCLHMQADRGSHF